MKTNQSRFFALAALTGLMSLGQLVRAEDTPATPPTPPAPPAVAAPDAKARMNVQMEKMFTAIKATDDQKEKLKPILKERNEKLRAMRQDSAISQDDKQAKQKEISQAANDKVKAILSSDQFEAFEKFQKDQRKARLQGAPETPKS
jgi:periplasmic protein CpxP/Spy